MSQVAYVCETGSVCTIATPVAVCTPICLLNPRPHRIVAYLRAIGKNRV